MQDSNQLASSMEASLKDAQKQIILLQTSTLKLLNGAAFADEMPRIRTRLSILNQRLHEANAYNNALTT